MGCSGSKAILLKSKKQKDRLYPRSNDQTKGSGKCIITENCTFN